MFLLNCTNCDDVQRLSLKVRYCECAQSRGVLHPRTELPKVEGLHARIIEIPWEQYDRAIEGETQTWRVCYAFQDGQTR